MKKGKTFKLGLATVLFLPQLSYGQVVDEVKYSDFQPASTPDYSLLTTGEKRIALPAYLNNAKEKYFPPVFNQSGGSCGAASQISYMFTHELNAYRDVDATTLKHRYPSHFVWLLSFGNSTRDDLAKNVGIPSAEVYGGQTYSERFGPQEDKQNDFGWMTGYDRWYSAMFNRISGSAFIPAHLGTQEGREAAKRWLYNHNGDTDFHAGGLLGVGVASAKKLAKIKSTPANDECGVTGLEYVQEWGTKFDHAMTIVGYDDRIEFDLNGNGIYGEDNADEKGAWIIVNSWGDKWANAGFVYCPYAFSGSTFVERNGKNVFAGDWWYPEVLRIAKDYRPLRTIKVKMDYSHRSEICLTVGVSADLGASIPEYTEVLDHFQYAGDGNNGKTVPAPAVPMLGRWADGRLHDEPMEFGYDLTRLSSHYDRSLPLKYFLIVDRKQTAVGKGHLYEAAVIDYEYDRQGVESLFHLQEGGKDILQSERKTIISTVVYGSDYYAPRNVVLDEKTLSWNRPLKSLHALKGYRVYGDGKLLAELEPDKENFVLTDEVKVASYSLTAVYDNKVESNLISVYPRAKDGRMNALVDLKHSGFTIPNLFYKWYSAVTIEYWINPNQLTNWNQAVGPGWGEFFMHANANGAVTAGWDMNNRMESSAGKLVKGRWTHVALVVDGATMKLYLDGKLSGTKVSKEFSGLGGFGDLTFSAADLNHNYHDAEIDEVRIWDYARSAKEIQEEKNVKYSGQVLPNGLIGYYKGNLIDFEDRHYLQDYVGDNHAELLNLNFEPLFSNQLKLFDPKSELKVALQKSNNPIVAGEPTSFTTVHSSSVCGLQWQFEGANISSTTAVCPEVTFMEPGQYEVKVVAGDRAGKCVADTLMIEVKAAPAPQADFTLTKSIAKAGERLTFMACQPQLHYHYEWTLPGAETPFAQGINVAAKYPGKGTYTVTLKVTAPDGREAVKNQSIEVKEVEPEADFEIVPAVVVKGETAVLKDRSKYMPIRWKWLLSSAVKNIVVDGQSSTLTPEVPGTYTVTLMAENGSGRNSLTRERGLVVCNADSENGLNFSNVENRVTMSKVPFDNRQRAFTVDWWMNPSNVAQRANGIGDSPETFMLETSEDKALVCYIKGKKLETARHFVVSGEWHHYAVVFGHARVFFYRDGELMESVVAGVPNIPALKTFVLGHAEAPLLGQIDELRIWKKDLKAEQICECANRPIENVSEEEKLNQLVLYYNFNQSSGDVKDLTSQENLGVRSGFGPDGDAWASSKGVFSLNMGETAKREDLTATYLKNYEQSFKHGESINGEVPDRYFELKDWLLENTTKEGKTVTGAHVDIRRGGCLTITTEQEGFHSLTNHKVYQRLTLPAGVYTFTAYFGSNEGECGESYLVAAQGQSLPDTRQLSKEALAYTRMKGKDQTTSNQVQFVLTEETEVAVGMVVNSASPATCSFSRFTLVNTAADFVTADGGKGYSLLVNDSGFNTLYLPYASIVPKGVEVYVVDKLEEGKAVLSLLNSKLIPARTGVVVKATAGDYLFEISTEKGNAVSQAQGVIKETSIEAGYKYYTFQVKEGQPGFYPCEETVLQAHTAFLQRPADDETPFYRADFCNTGIGDVIVLPSDAKTYDMSGRSTTKRMKGVYIVNGKKVVNAVN